MMGDAFFEETVPQKKTVSSLLLKALLIALTAATLFLGLFAGFLFMLAFVVLIIVDYFAFPRFNVEYEYSYVNGDIDIAAIYNKENRKHLASIEAADIECVAPLGSSELSSYGATYGERDYSGHMSEKTPWVVVTGGEGRMKYDLLLTDEMIGDLRYRMPRKVFLS